MFLPQKNWQIMTIPGGSVLGTAGMGTKIALAVGGATAGALLLGGAKQYLSQKQEQEAVTRAETGGYTIQVEPGGTANIYQPTTGKAQATSQQDQAQEGGQEAKTTDYTQLLLIGGLIIGGLYFLKKRK
jgi:hypothetical protein